MSPNTYSPITFLKHDILRRFLLEFLPPVMSRHRNMANEENYIYTTVGRIFLQLFSMRVPAEEIRQLLFGEGYIYFTKSAIWMPERYCFILERSYPIRTRLLPTCLDNPPAGERLHWGMDGKTVRTLRLATIPCPENASEERKAAYMAMQEHLDRFLKKYKARAKM